MLTHGHEDHIGARALPAAREAGHPAGRLAAHPGAGRGQAAASTASRRTRSRCARATGEQFGPFDCEFFAVNHSIPDALAVAIRTPAGLVLHTGDFKMDQLPLDGRLTDLRGVRPARRRGRRPAAGRLDQRRGARASSPPSARSGRCSTTVFAQATSSGSSSPRFASPRAPGAAGARRGRRSTAARSRSSAGRWCATWASPATSATCDVPGRADGRRQGARRPARRPGRARLHRLAGRADVGAVPDGQPRPRDPDRRGRHGDPRVLADPRQRERGLPGDQRAVPLGRDGRAQGERAGARVRPRVGRRAALPLQRRPAAATSCRCTASGGTCGPTPSWPC